VRRISKIRRIGHAGTLDPAATGVLVLALGPTTRLIEYVQDDTRKTYRAVVRLGTATDTDDAAGTVVAHADIPPFDDQSMRSLLAQFVGTIEQVPPAYSALHVDGKRAYELARQGTAPELPARPVTVYAITLVMTTTDTITLDVVCGKGTYIRSLARDIGRALGTVAHLQSLIRTAVGAFTLEQSIALDALTAELLPTLLLPNRIALADWPTVILDTAGEARVRNGLRIPANYPIGTRIALVGDDGELLATAVQRDTTTVAPTKVFRWSDDA
jgi:tRNA pseudouridine55 synthase